jgi:hypothetical protein
MDFSDLFFVTRLVVPVALICYAVIKKDKTIGALVQMGNLQTRLSRSEDLSKVELLRKEELQLADKVTFTLGVLNVAITPYILGAAPTLFYLLYTPKAVLLIALRWIDFVKQKKQWLVRDPPLHIWRMLKL